jgi:hypothetical protein
MTIFRGLSLIALMMIPASASDYFPFCIGNTWVLDALDSTGSVTGRDSSVIDTSFNLSNREIFLMDEFYTYDYGNDSTYTLFFSNDNDIYLLTENPLDSTKVFQHTYVNGQKYTSDIFSSDTMTVDDIGRVTVPAGTFDSCFFVNSNGSGCVFAPDVGIIKSVDNGRDIYVLRSYHVRNAGIIPNPLHPKSKHPASARPVTCLQGRLVFSEQIKADYIRSFDLFNSRGITVWRTSNSFPEGDIIIPSQPAGTYVARIKTSSGVYTGTVNIVR